ncbi:MAG TPA: threo-3-hydroxy-L-aspartate ammonia-lyase [Verrucomicrobiae bacterium]|jgi:threonine dehydratase|nr:threo-3-hydroxy-L-aspartate ammonia-lyase [Verrucomicrobiae bacterium]
MDTGLFQRVQAARETLRGQAHVTPVVTSRTLNQAAGAEIFCKCENLQRIGAFKFRGAFNAVSHLTPAQKAAGVITFSSGNHAQAIALACQILGVRATIVMPRDAPAAKRAATAGYGAEVVLCEPHNASREKVAAELQSRHGYTLIPPFDHLDVIAGQGTAAAELLEQAPNLDWVITPCGGGGLLSGTAIAVKNLRPGCRVAGIEPEVADDAARSFATKTLQTVLNPFTIADGTRTASLGQLTFPLVLQHVDEMKTVSEDAIRDAVRFLFYRMKLVVEPSGALGVAALLSGSFRPAGRIGVILSGGNVDGAAMAALLQ